MSCFAKINLLFIAIFIFSSCKKEKSSVEFTSITSGTDFTLYEISQISDDSLVACGGKNQNGIVIISTDGGNTWRVLNNSFDQAIHDVYFLNSKKGFAAGDTTEVFKTSDGGITWNKLPTNFPNYPATYRIPLHKIFFTNDSTGFICGGERFEAGIIIKTTDGGKTWSLRLFDMELRSLYFLNETTGFACGYGAILKTTDSGNNWNFISVPNEFYTSLNYANGELFATGYNGGILNSKDGGNTWDFINKSNNVTSSRWHFNCFAPASNNKMIACGADGAASFSTDKGMTWNEGESFDRSTIKSILMKNENSGFAVGTDGKIFIFSF